MDLILDFEDDGVVVEPFDVAFLHTLVAVEPEAYAAHEGYVLHPPWVQRVEGRPLEEWGRLDCGVAPHHPAHVHTEEL